MKVQKLFIWSITALISIGIVTTFIVYAIFPLIFTSSPVCDTIDCISQRLDYTPILSEDSFSTINKKDLPPQELLARLTNNDSRITSLGTESDGEDGELAYVQQISTDGTQWEMYYDPIDTFDSNGNYISLSHFISTLVHEYGHVLSLNETQIRHNQSNGVTCAYNEVGLDEGCALSQSYIRFFKDRFWPEYSYADKRLSDDQVLDRFEGNKDEFVSVYAASELVEDFAETFSVFILTQKPTQNRIVDQKVLSLYQYDELVNMKLYIQDQIKQIINN